MALYSVSMSITISIHALLAESDPLTKSVQPRKTISIHALLAESDLLPHSADCNCHNISIHALLAESDAAMGKPTLEIAYFYPRSPCGERRVTVLGIQHRVGISIHALLAESDAIRGIVLKR